MAGHLHMGGYNGTLYRGEAPDPDRAVYSIDANYGTEVGVVGNERCFVKNMTECLFGEKGEFVMKKGEHRRLVVLGARCLTSTVGACLNCPTRRAHGLSKPHSGGFGDADFLISKRMIH